jgi:hypothetical protein
MAINVIERAVTPYNNPGNRISNKERYSLYAPAAGINKPGMAGYDPEYFAVREQIVQLSSAFLASILRHVVMDDSIDPDGIKDTNTVYSNFVHEVIDRRDVEGTVSNLTVTGSLFVFRSDDVITEALFADGRIWTRRLKVISGGIENVTQFEPEYDKHVTYDELAVNAVGTRTLQDGSIVTAKIVAKAVTADKLDDKAVTADKLDDKAVTADKLDDKAVTADKLDDKAVTVNKLSEELQQKFAQYDADVDSKAFISVSYNPVDGKLTFTSINGTTEIIDLPLELIVSGGYYKDTDDVDSLVLVLANGEEIEIPFDDVFADIIKEVAGDGVEIIEVQSLSELPENPKEGTFAILPLGSYSGEGSNGGAGDTNLEQRVTELENYNERHVKDSVGFTEYLDNVARNPEYEGCVLVVENELWVPKPIQGQSLPVVTLTTSLNGSYHFLPKMSTILNSEDGAALDAASAIEMPIVVKFSIPGIGIVSAVGDNTKAGYFHCGYCAHNIVAEIQKNSDQTWMMTLTYVWNTIPVIELTTQITEGSTMGSNSDTTLNATDAEAIESINGNGLPVLFKFSTQNRSVSAIGQCSGKMYHLGACMPYSTAVIFYDTPSTSWKVTVSYLNITHPI